MRGQKPSLKLKDEVWQLWREGNTQVAIAAFLGIDRGTVKAIINGVSADNGQSWLDKHEGVGIPDPRVKGFPRRASEALADPSGVLFMLRYFGLRLSAFQCRMWGELEELWATDDREFYCLNAPPGLGKSTVLVGFACKRIVLWRGIRVLFISRAQSLAERLSGQTRRALERTTPMVDAQAALAADFGRFKPAQAGDVWRRSEFVVEQLDGASIESKEPTVSSFGFDAEWLGNRLDLMFGDDLDSTRSIRNFDTVTTNRQIFDDELEPRLESGGLLAITQQRLGVFDFSAHAMSKRIIFGDDDGESDDVESESQYRHSAFKAHYEECCGGRETHRPDAPAWPEGCLLDPRRLSWRDVRKAMINRRRFAVVYQQTEADEFDALVPRVWVDGGRGRDGVEYPGCWDLDRGLAQVPPGLAGRTMSIVTCDPSVKQNWSVQWWLYHVDTEQRILLDIVRQNMGANDFLDFNLNAGRHTGLLEDWWQRSNDMRIPFRWLIVEANAAHRYMMQYDLFLKWAQSHEVLMIPHQTQRNKSDPEMGVQSIAGIWEFGKVRLPGKYGDPGRIAALKLVDEVTRWPNGGTDDCVMAQWFLEWNLPRLVPRRNGPLQHLWRPTWLAKSA